MRHHPLNNNPDRMTVEQVLRALVFYGEVEGSDGAKKGEKKRKDARKLHDFFSKRWSDKSRYITAQDLSDLLEKEVWTKDACVSMHAFKDMAKSTGLFNCVPLRELSPIATIIYLYEFAIPRKGGVPVLPDKKFGWIGLEKAAQDVRAACWYLQLFVAPAESRDLVEYEDAREALYPIIRTDPHAILAVAGSWIGMPLTEKDLELVRQKGTEAQAEACSIILSTSRVRKWAAADRARR